MQVSRKTSSRHIVRRRTVKIKLHRAAKMQMGRTLQPHHTLLLLLVKRIHVGIDECFNTGQAWLHFSAASAVLPVHGTIELASVHKVKGCLSGYYLYCWNAFGCITFLQGKRALLRMTLGKLLNMLKSWGYACTPCAFTDLQLLWVKSNQMCIDKLCCCIFKERTLVLFALLHNKHREAMKWLSLHFRSAHRNPLSWKNQRMRARKLIHTCSSFLQHYQQSQLNFQLPWLSSLIRNNWPDSWWWRTAAKLFLVAMERCRSKM